MNKQVLRILEIYIHTYIHFRGSTNFLLFIAYMYVYTIQCATTHVARATSET